MDTITYSAPAISCEHCQHAIERAIGALPGVRSVQVTIPARTVQVHYDRAIVSTSQLESALEEEGYPVAR
jgi:copper chaperone